MRMRIQINMKYFSAIYKKHGMFKAWQQNNELKFFKYMHTAIYGWNLDEQTEFNIWGSVVK